MRFRKSRSIGGVRLTMTSTGLGVSAGVKGARVSVNTKGQVHGTVSAPGTGLSHTKRLDGRTQTQPAQPVAETDQQRRARFRQGRADYRANLAAGMPKADAKALLRAASKWTVQA